VARTQLVEPDRQSDAGVRGLRRMWVAVTLLGGPGRTVGERAWCRQVGLAQLVLNFEFFFFS
jgi:hypothetical protein